MALAVLSVVEMSLAMVKFPVRVPILIVPLLFIPCVNTPKLKALLLVKPIFPTGVVEVPAAKAPTLFSE